VRGGFRSTDFAVRMGFRLVRVRMMRAAADHRMKCDARGGQPSEKSSHGFLIPRFPSCLKSSAALPVHCPAFHDSHE
jgi:hypothetical protein